MINLIAALACSAFLGANLADRDYGWAPLFLIIGALNLIVWEAHR